MYTAKYRGIRIDNHKWTHGYLCLTRWHELEATDGNEREREYYNKCRKINGREWFYAIQDCNDPMVIRQVYPGTVGQFTGEYDSTEWDRISKKEQRDFYCLVGGAKSGEIDDVKHLWKGREIYHGDILHSPHGKELAGIEGGILLKVAWKRHAYGVAGGWEFRLLRENNIHMRESISSNELKHFKVIGSIYNDPELSRGVMTPSKPAKVEQIREEHWMGGVRGVRDLKVYKVLISGESASNRGLLSEDNLNNVVIEAIDRAIYYEGKAENLTRQIDKLKIGIEGAMGSENSEEIFNMLTELLESTESME